MSTARIIVWLLVGLVLIVKGGDIFVDAATWIAKKSGIPEFIIGATVVSLATTLPEMLVSVFAAAEGKVDMAVGNAIGSVTANTGLIMGIALCCIPMAIRLSDYLIRSLLMLGGALIIVISGFRGEVGILPSLLLVAIFLASMADNIHQARTSLLSTRTIKAAARCSCTSADGMAHEPDCIFFDSVGVDVTISQSGGLVLSDTTKSLLHNETFINTLKFLGGAASIVVGAQLLVDNGSALALLLEVPERVIGVTIIAVGTSLPELVTTVTAIVKKKGALSIGNIIGANIIDLALILPICSIISGRALPIYPQVAQIDLPACLIISVLGLIPALIIRRFTRIQGVFLIAAYCAYVFITAFVV